VPGFYNQEMLQPWNAEEVVLIRQARSAKHPGLSWELFVRSPRPMLFVGRPIVSVIVSSMFPIRKKIRFASKVHPC